MASSTGTTGSRRWRTVFSVYALGLAVGLLWPALQIPDVVPRPDLIVHGATFGAFTWLASLALREGGCGPGRALLLAALGGVAFGGITELLQGLPIIRRTGAWDDFYADVFGVGLGVLAAWLAGRWVRTTARGNR